MTENIDEDIEITKNQTDSGAEKRNNRNRH